jgi:hypothetical protein
MLQEFKSINNRTRKQVVFSVSPVLKGTGNFKNNDSQDMRVTTLSMFLIKLIKRS